MSTKILGWGSNSHGQIGLGIISEQEPVPKLLCVDKEGKQEIIQFFGGANSTIILSNTNHFYVAGSNDQCQLTNLINTQTPSLQSFVVLPQWPREKVAKVSCGWNFTLCLTENGNVFSWGSNSYGQLGLGANTKEVSVPTRVNVLCAKDIACGLRHSLVIDIRGKVLSVGSNSRGQLGRETRRKEESVFGEVNVPDSSAAASNVSCGEHFSISSSGTHIYAWGDNRFGQLGLSSETVNQTVIPLRVSAQLSAEQNLKKISCGWAHSIILTGNGRIISWGRNNYGQLGEARSCCWLPKYLDYPEVFKQIAVGSQHTVALTEKGDVLAWGWNEHGSCGNGTLIDQKQPVLVNLPSNLSVLLIGSGAAHSFVYGKLKIKGTEAYQWEVPENSGDEESSILKIPRFDGSLLSYSEFFEKCLLRNEPCIIENIGQDWPALRKWASVDGPNMTYFLQRFNTAHVCVAKCDTQIYNAQDKVEMALKDYISMWLSGEAHARSLYLKDWHLLQSYPQEEGMYTVPKFFSSDWLGEYFDRHPELNDDYRFVYIGPKESWTPLHVDVFSSYSWSINVAGKKRWILLKPGAESAFQNILVKKIQKSLTVPADLRGVYDFVQEAGEAIFVPSGWYHQVWNLEDTISINHNWVNATNIHNMWNSMKKTFEQVQKEINDCKEMPNWDAQCQVMLKALYGMEFSEFYSFLREIIDRRVELIKEGKQGCVFGGWLMGEKLMLFDIERCLSVLTDFVNYLIMESINCIEESHIEHPVDYCYRIRKILKLQQPISSNAPDDPEHS